jgi:hypothetical protein
VVIAEHSGPAAWDITLNVHCPTARQDPVLPAAPNQCRDVGALRTARTPRPHPPSRIEPVRFYLI